MRNKFETLARGGYAARGLVYVLLGGLAFMSALNGGGNTEDSSGALSHVLQVPFGRILLALIAIGLIGHIAWRLAQGLLDADTVGSDGKGLVGRVGSLISAGANVFLALTAARMALGQGGGGGSGGGGESEASAWLLQQPFGPFLLGLVAIGVIGAGLAQIFKGVSRKYRDRLDLPKSPKMLDFACFFGLVARGGLLAIVGGFVAYAALTVSPEQAGGISDALDYVHAMPFGRWLYGIAALGLVAFGCYSIIQAVYRHMNAPSLADVRQALPG